MKRFIPAIVCLSLAIVLILPLSMSSFTSTFNTYPNLPAPIAKEKVLITSAGQAVEGAIIQSIAENLNLEADYRPRALHSDLYEYKSVIVVVGFSNNGLTQTVRNFSEELNRSKELVMEARANSLPVIIVDLSAVLRDNEETWQLLDVLIPHTTYYIGFTPSKGIEKIRETLKEYKVLVTLVDQINEIEVPLNSAYR
jgi:hypothetical protein